MSFGSEITHSSGFCKFNLEIARTTFLVPATRPVTALAADDVARVIAFDNIFFFCRCIISTFLLKNNEIYILKVKKFKTRVKNTAKAFL